MMGYDIHRWLMNELPAECSILERAVAAQLAIRADDHTRETWPTLEELARWTGAKNEASVRQALKNLAAHGWEFRIPIGQRKGRVLYAVHGHKLSFRVPSGPGTDSPVPTKDSGVSTKDSPVLSKDSPTAPETKRPGETNGDHGSDTPLRSVSGAHNEIELWAGELHEPEAEERTEEEQPSKPDPSPAPALVGEVLEQQHELTAKPSKPASKEWHEMVKAFGGSMTIVGVAGPKPKIDVRAPRQATAPSCAGYDEEFAGWCRCGLPKINRIHQSALKRAA